MPDKNLAQLPLYKLRLDPSDVPAVEAAKSIRADCQNLQRSVLRGEYDQDEVELYWALLERASLNLMVSNAELSERANLGSRFFTEVTRDRRYPKYNNFVRSLQAIIDIADDRLLEIDSLSMAVKHEWAPNPIYNTKFAEELRNQLFEVIHQLRASNSLSSIPEIDTHQRQYLIDLLETTIALLKAPLIEKGIVKRTAQTLTIISQKIASDSSAGFFGGLAGAAALALAKVIGGW